MLEFIVGFFSDFVGWLVGALPASPFQGVLLGLSGDELVWLGWLNWCIPVGDFLDIFSVWLVAALVCGAAYFTVSMVTRIGQMVFGL